MINSQKIKPCLWFDGRAEEAANFYVAIFKNSRITNISHFGDAGQEIHGQKAGRTTVCRA
jgi:predicted 3-demethylubiquinone-9 3-methyltransferase (glyoxalase superfamily)